MRVHDSRPVRVGTQLADDAGLAEVTEVSDEPAAGTKRKAASQDVVAPPLDATDAEDVLRAAQRMGSPITSAQYRYVGKRGKAKDLLFGLGAPTCARRMSVR